MSNPRPFYQGEGFPGGPVTDHKGEYWDEYVNRIKTQKLQEDSEKDFQWRSTGFEEPPFDSRDEQKANLRRFKLGLPNFQQWVLSLCDKRPPGTYGMLQLLGESLIESKLPDISQKNWKKYNLDQSCEILKYFFTSPLDTKGNEKTKTKGHLNVKQWQAFFGMEPGDVRDTDSQGSKVPRSNLFIFWRIYG